MDRFAACCVSSSMIDGAIQQRDQQQQAYRYGRAAHQ
jgi:hypothetical protein